MANIDTLTVNGNIGNNFLKLAMKKIYPVGSLYYTTMEHGDPGSVYGAGEWALIMEDQISVGAGSNGTTSYVGGNTGGAVNQQHYHSQTFGYDGNEFMILTQGGKNNWISGSTPTNFSSGSGSRIINIVGRGYLGLTTTPSLTKTDSGTIRLNATSTAPVNVVQPSYRVFIYKRLA